MRFIVHNRCFCKCGIIDRPVLMPLAGFYRQKRSKDCSKQKYQGPSIYGWYYNNQSYCTKQMSFNQAQCDQAVVPVYGFLCQETNVFYAFQTQEQYLEFIEWFESQAQEPTSSNCGEMLTDEEIKLNSEKATANIMKIFEDPIFHHEDSMMEMEQIDF